MQVYEKFSNRDAMLQEIRWIWLRNGCRGVSFVGGGDFCCDSHVISVLGEIGFMS